LHGCEARENASDQQPSANSIRFHHSS
jgi:hypothetical protein